jgi:feruloyl esterase
MMQFFRTGAAILIAGALAACAASQKPADKQVAQAPNLQSSRCADLASISIPGFVVKITKAASVSADATLPAHCLIEGDINPRVGFGGKPYALGFALSLPDVWNGRFLYQGGGGYDGVMRPPIGPQNGGPPALARGFAVVFTDSGHKGGTPAFMEDQQATLDFAQESVGKVTQVAKKIIETYYSRPPQYSYFTGCSNGGREAMLAAQRYPTMFDGIVASDPGMRSENTRFAAAWTQLVFEAAAPKDATGKPQLDKLYSDADRRLVSARILEACDDLDGLKDGLIFNASACRFDPATLICKGRKTDTCLTKAQVEAIKAAIAGPKTRGGIPVYSRFAYDPNLVVSRFMPSAPTPAQGQPFPTFEVDQAVANIALDGAWQLVATAGWTNYSTFFGHGGKLIFTSGLSDPAFSAFDTVDYYERALQANGGPVAARASTRLFLIPGRGHCGSGTGTTLNQFDTLDAVVNWVEKGLAPEFIVANVSNASGQQRPLCAWPAYAHYNGMGDPKDAANFECRQPTTK